MNIIYIDEASELASLCERLGNTRWFAVDTEFEREKTYYPELCLLQVAAPDVTAVIDPLAIENLEPLCNLLNDGNITKVFHSARQDLEIFFHLTGSVPGPLFDTQLAAPMLGYEESSSYSGLVSKMFGIELDKSYTRSNWKQRPLNDNQLKYAADDVIYLARMYENFREQLAALGRLEQLNADFNALQNPQLYAPDPGVVWKKIRHHNRFTGRKLAVLQQLAAWRENTARQENRPRNWLLKDAAIMDLARQLPCTDNELLDMKDINAKQVHRYGDALLGIIQKA